mgnify:CR=1 FL=1
MCHKFPPGIVDNLLKALAIPVAVGVVPATVAPVLGYAVVAAALDEVAEVKGLKYCMHLTQLP